MFHCYSEEQLFAREEADTGDLGRPAKYSTITQLIVNDFSFNAVHFS